MTEQQMSFSNVLICRVHFNHTTKSLHIRLTFDGDGEFCVKLIKTVNAMLTKSNETRVYFRARNPNPLFQSWLEHWLREAEHKDSRKKYALAKALESLQKYPLVLHSGRECAILEGFGHGICTMLDEQLRLYRQDNPTKALDERATEIKERTILGDAKQQWDDQKGGELAAKKIRLSSHFDDSFDALLRKYGDLCEKNSIPVEPKSNIENRVDEFMPPRVHMAKQSFKIVLLVDTQETAG